MALWIFLAVMTALAGTLVYVVKGVLSDTTSPKKSFVTVTLMKPPPAPPPVKEKPPEPKQVTPPKKQEVVTQTRPESKPVGQPDNKPAGKNLGVDAKGTAGSDAFGLVAKQGGRSIIGGGGGNGWGRMSALLKYAGYSQTVQNEIRKAVLKQLNEMGVNGKFQITVKLVLDALGKVTKIGIAGSSGNGKVDEAVKQSLSNFKVSAPPKGMPDAIEVKIAHS
ncbi:MAG: TonB family protein [Nitrospiraceae bacterium]|nr:TonB family protein [Nitrospiraceae bacterium]